MNYQIPLQDYWYQSQPVLPVFEHYDMGYYNYDEYGLGYNWYPFTQYEYDDFYDTFPIPKTSDENDTNIGVGCETSTINTDDGDVKCEPTVEESPICNCLCHQSIVNRIIIKIPHSDWLNIINSSVFDNCYVSSKK
jgi:hypothetical protein